MKIYQGYKSKAMVSFEFMEIHKLEKYTDEYKPMVLFGCYTDDDIALINNHKSVVVIQWEGLDSKRWSNLSVFKKPNIINVSPHKVIVDYFARKDLKCQEIYFTSNETMSPQMLGSKVYAYVNKNNPIYYGQDVLNKLNVPYSLLVADYSIPQEKFRGEIRNSFYSQMFIGLMVGKYAGGGFSIVEMGLRGIKVVTNVLNLPHTIPWRNVLDVERAITEESEHIGTVNKGLAQQVYQAVICSEKLECYDLDQLIKYK